jgi:class 3 adenylate cyclase/tetratricopeptide (TPR) repeat protein
LAVEVGVLGRLRLLDGDVEVGVGGPRVRALLAALALGAGDAVSVDRLVDALWGDDPPRSATKVVQNHVLRLRKALGSAAIVTLPSGYALSDARRVVDAWRFEAMVRDPQAMTANGEVGPSAAGLGEALALWRGRPFEELAGWPPADAAAVRLEELRRLAEEEHLDARLANGEDAGCVPDLEGLVAAEPLREHRWAQLMLALFRSGRQADALRVFQRARETLGRELGVEPGTELRDLEASILAQDPKLARPRVGGQVSGPQRSTDVVAVLFTDLVGSTALWAGLGEAAAGKLRRAHDNVLLIAVESHGGKVIKGLGDGIMASFDGAGDAVAAAVAIQQGIQRRNRRSPTPLGVRIGISVGDVTWENADCFGPPVVEASRLCEAAAEGQILVAELVRAMARGRGGHQFHPVGELELKGLPAPLPALAVSWSATEPQSLPPALARSAAGFFVGRDAEVELLGSAWKQATEGSLRIVMVAGEPGIGKTRLAAQLAGQVVEDKGTVWYGRCDEDLGVPYQPFAEALRPYVAACPLDELAAHVAAHEGELGRLIPELARRLPEVPPPLQAEPEVERFRLFEAVGGWLADVASRDPVLLVLDDLHWAAKPTLLLLRHLVAHCESAPALIVGTFRNTEMGRTHPLADTLADLRRLEGVERLTLAGLDPDGVTAFVEATAGQTLEEPGQALARALHAETEGNPFFVGQMLRHLAETGAISIHDGQWAYDAGLHQHSIPEGAREVIGRRLSRLTETTDRVLQVSSVIGRDFDVDVLTRASGVHEDDVLTSLDEATAARLITEVPDTPDGYTFVHALVRETLYEEVGKSRRVRLHRRVGEVLEDLRAADLGPYFAQLAHHFGQAAERGGIAKAIGYARQAAERATAVLAYEEAAGHYERALALLEREGSPGEATRGELLVALGQARYGAGEPVQARATCAEAAAIASRQRLPELLARAALAYNDATFAAFVYFDQPAVEAAGRLLRQALDALGDGETALHALLLAQLSRTLGATATTDEKVLWTTRAREIATDLGDRALLANALDALNWTRDGPAHVKDNLDTARQIVALAHEIGDRPREYWGRIQLGNSLLELGDIAAVDQETSALEQLGAELCSPQYHYFPVLRRAMRALLDGRLEESERLAFEAFAIGQQMHSEEQALGILGAQLFTIRRYQGRLGELEDAVRAEVDRLPLNPAWRCALCTVLCSQERTPEAREAFEQVATHDFTDLPHDHLYLMCLFQLTETCVYLGDQRRAALLYDLLAPYAHLNIMIKPGVIVVGSVAHCLGQLAATVHRWEEAETHFEAAIAFNTGMGAHPATASTQVAYARMLLERHAPGDAERADTLLSVAAATADALGIVSLKADTQALLAATNP